MTANVDAMVREAIRAYRAGQKPEARALLERATEMDEYNEQAWLWLSAVVETPEDQRTCLQNVLYINPNNENAKKGLEVLNTQLGTPPPAATDDDDDPLASASFGASSSSPFTADDEDADEDDEDASDFPVTATSSASSVFVPPEPSQDVYDDWVANLNIGGAGGAEPEPELDDDAFASAFADDFGEDVDEPSYSSSSPSSADSTYGDIDFGFDDDESGVYQPASDLDDLFSDSDDTFGSGPFSTESIGYDTDIDIDTDLLGVGDDLPISSPPGRQDSPRSPARETSDDPAISTGEFYIGGEAVEEDLDPSEYFHSIPKGIKPTRVPGMDERYPTLVVISLLLLVLLNVGAVAMLVINMSG